jgi:2-hydroxychromene-2-carboxylate isomerase
LLRKLEINQEQFFDGIKNQIVKDELKKFTNDAFKKEVFGAPTFIVNNKIFWGQDRLEYAIEELN